MLMVDCGGLGLVLHPFPGRGPSRRLHLVEVPYDGGARVNVHGRTIRIPGRGPSRRLRSVACGGALRRWRMSS